MLEKLKSLLRRTTPTTLIPLYLKDIEHGIFTRRLAILRLQGEVDIFVSQRRYLLSQLPAEEDPEDSP